MDVSAAVGDPRALESLLAFWADAGVEALFQETPNDRLAPRTPTAPPSSPSAALVVRPISTPSARPSSAAIARDAAAECEDLAALLAAATGRLRLRGATQPDVVFVVEGPEAEDQCEDAAFTGSKGRLLDAMLRAVAIEGRSAIVAGAACDDDEQRAATPFLERLLELTRPRAVVAVGTSATRLFFRSHEPILRLRGRWIDWRGAHFEVVAPVLAMLSPTLLLRQPSAKKLAWMDILSLAARLETEPTSDLA